MKVINPTDSKIEIQYRGVIYSVDANSVTENVPEEVATHWKSMVHAFVRLEEDGATTTDTKTVEAPAEETQESAPEVAQEEVEVAPQEEVVVVTPKKSKK